MVKQVQVHRVRHGIGINSVFWVPKNHQLALEFENLNKKKLWEDYTKANIYKIYEYKVLDY